MASVLRGALLTCLYFAGAVIAVFPVVFTNLYGMHTAAQYSWFIGCGVASVLYYLLATKTTRFAVTNVVNTSTTEIEVPQ